MTVETSTARDRYSTVVVGAGIAGLTVAAGLADARALVLEREPEIGGRVRSIALGDHVYNRGAQVIIGHHSLVGEVASGLGLGLRRVPKGVRTLHMRGRYVRARSDPGYLARIPLSLAEKRQLVATVLRLRVHYRFLAGHPVDVSDPRVAELDRVTFAEFVRARTPGLRALWDTLCLNTASVPADEVAALHPVRGLLDFMTPEWHVEGGMGRLPAELGSRLTCPIHLGAEVVVVDATRDAVRIEYLRAGRRYRVFADQCVMAVPSPIILRVVRGLPDWKIAVLSRIDFAMDASAAFLLGRSAESVVGPSVWRVPVVGRTIIGIVNPGVSLSAAERSSRRGGLIRVYLGQPSARRLQGESDEHTLDILQRELTELFPAVAGAVTERVLTRWEFADSPWRPGRAALGGQLSAAVGRVHFCGDFIDPAGMEGAVRTARQVVKEITGHAAPTRPRPADGVEGVE